MTDKMKRIITALILAPIVLLGIIYLSDQIFFIVAEIVILIATVEFYKMIKSADMPILMVPSIVGAVLVPYSLYASSLMLFAFGMFFTVFLAMTVKLFATLPLEKSYEHISVSLLSVLYVPFLFSFLFLLKQINFHTVFYLLFIIWLSDSGAYLFGMKFGKNRMYEKISPKKSMEGLFAGLTCGVGAAVVYNLFFLDFTLVHALLSGLLVAVAGVIGDLIESMFKRSAGVKDSGTIIPGHGGMLDRIDSMLLGAPVLYFYIKLLIE